MNHPLVVNKRSGKPYDVYVGRPSPWGNPFTHAEGTLAQLRVPNRDMTVEAYRKWLLEQPELVARARRELRGKILACWCAPLACHADVLAEVANAFTEEDVAALEKESDDTPY